MGGYFVYNSETGRGYYMTDEEMAQGAGVIAAGVGALAIWGIIGMVLGLVLIAPFLTLGFLDDFVGTFVANNVQFFGGIGVVVTLLKFMRKTAYSKVVRIIFDSYILLSSLYLLLYVFRFDVLIYTIFRVMDTNLPPESDRAIIEIWGINNLIAATEGNWFYETINFLFDKYLDFAKWSINNLLTIDNSCLLVSANQINIIEVIKTLCLYLVLGGFAVLSNIILGLLFLLTAMVSVVLPYVLAIALMIVINKAIFRLHVITMITPEHKYIEKISICADELNTIISARKGYYSTGKITEVYQKAAAAGNPIGQALLAQCYLSGDGVRQDERKAFYWYKKAASGGSVEGQLMLSCLYCFGDEIKRNRFVAKLWLKVAQNNKNYNEYRNNEQIKNMVLSLQQKTRIADCL